MSGDHGKVKDLTGKIFGDLEVLRLDGVNERGAARWVCRCDCGNETVVGSANLMSGNTKSCGCYAETVKRVRTARYFRDHSFQFGRQS